MRSEATLRSARGTEPARQRNSLNDQRIRNLHFALERRRPRLLAEEVDMARAAVGLLIRPATEDLEVLLIERSKSDHDPWSGHMALPGGRRQLGEEGLDTAMRETLEEVGIDLAAYGMFIGRLDDVEPSDQGPRIAVAPFVFAVPPGTDVALDPVEVADAVWIPLRHLSDPTAAAEHLHAIPGGDPRQFPALAYDHRVIWGLTYRMLIQFLGIVRSARRREAS